MRYFQDDESAYPIHLGLWTNWSNGPVLGSTLTVTSANANFLIVLVALFSTIVAGHIWIIFCFILHIGLSSRHEADPVYQQRQVIFRNNSGPLNAAWGLAKVAWAWRRKRRLAAVFPFISFAVLLALALLVLTTLSSSIAIGNTVLLSGKRCGILEGYGNATDTSTIVLPWLARRTAVSASYAQQCYQDAQLQKQPSRCQESHFVKRQIHGNVNLNAACPFSSAICRTEGSNLEIDTGLIDSDSDIGINTPSEERLQFREVLQCAPLITEGRKAAYNATQDRPFQRYYFGKPLTRLRPDAFVALDEDTITYQYPDSSATQAELLAQNYAWADYTLETLTAYPTNGTVIDDGGSEFEPIPELHRSDADIFLFFLSTNTIGFSTPPQDPWYYPDHAEGSSTSAEDPANETDIKSVALTCSKEAASPLACAYQQQVCISGGKTCTPLGSTSDTVSAAEELFKDEHSYPRFAWIFDALGQGGSIAEVVQSLKASALTSRLSLSQGVQGAIAANQWQIDVQYWHAVSLAGYQRAMVDTAAGILPDDEMAIVRPDSPTEEALCDNQKIVSRSHVSFSVFGLVAILVFGLGTIGVSLSLEWLLDFVQKRWGLSPYARLEWISNGTLQLQRLANEALGLGGTWSNCCDAVPRAGEAGTGLAMLDIADEEHPVLRIPEDRKEFDALRSPV
ncbi:hypothetical protein F4778DRAFT_799859 [Xylariomycetidae sp. FL2044]|nr:hypothetical protein F4778DRAFT_799859 [Xylariomycetidae sp. FL2044]